MTILSPTRSIRAKLALLIAASVGAAVLIAFGIATYRELTRFAEAKRAEMQATAEILAVSVADAVAAGSRAEARQALHAIGRIPGVKFAEIRDPRGDRFAEAGVGVGLASDGGGQAESSLLEMLTRGSIVVETKIVKAGQTVGRLGLLVDTSELGRRLEQALVAAALSAAAAILIGLVVAARLQRSITRPVGELTATMNRVRLTSDFSARAERHSDDETGQLVDAFNDMLDQIGQRDLALEEHRAGLERTVEQRTRQLAHARDAAEAANRAKSDFLATMSHEIRTPMNGMLVMAELLAGAELPARQQRYAETIVRSGQTLLTIINDILDLSKIEAGKLELEQGRVPVATIIDDVLGLFWERAASKNLDLAARIGADVPAVIEGDPVRLSQILANLVNNALKFTDSGHVIIAVERRVPPRPGDAELVFSVRDTGIGVPAEKIDRIFEAFSQADQSTTRRYGGTGLGLSISQRLVAAMGGRIWVDSRPGEGSTFAFSVPASVLEEAASKLPRWRGAALIAVEGEATQAVLGADLATAGYAVRTASGEPVEDAGDVDLVFAGPGWIERMGPVVAPNRAIVICVAPIGNGDVDRLLSAGLADGLLLQPVSSARLRDVLAAAESGTLSALLAVRREDAGIGLPDFSGVNVLVADDSPVNREVVSEALGRLNAQTRTVEDGRQAVEMFQSGDFDIVLMDCSMPGLDGFAATRAIRTWEAERGAARTPVVALTAHVAGAAPGSWRDAGMDDYLSKPFTLRGLADCLARWLPERQAIPPDHAPAPPAGLKGAEFGATALDPAVLASLRSIAGRDTAMLERVFNLFGVHAPARLSALCEALAAGDVAGVAAEAHALKSPSLNIGALRLAALAAEVEAQARSGELPPDEIPDRLRAELQAVMTAIRPETAAASPSEARERAASPSP